MKRSILTGFFAAGLALSAAPSAYAQEAKQDFTLSNRTGYELKEVYVAPSASDEWENDVLGTGTLGDGVAVEIKFNRASKTCKWDLKVVYTVDSSNAVWKNIDLCSVDKITIRYNKTTDTTSASFD
ncbi:MAG: argininosuccinate lyase [Acetobacteraceae bacterium]|nr:argininosuccinate lyase [Acetobacteraceae bacterium]